MRFDFHRLRKVSVSLLVTVAFVFPSTLPAGVEQSEKALKASTADHSKFEELQAAFKTGPDVTEACLKCHTEAAKQLHQTKHWNWKFTNPETGQTVGKMQVINNFCLSVGFSRVNCEI